MRPFKIIIGDCIEIMTRIPDETIQCVVTSPPYWGLRDYNVDGQLGLEKTPDEYVNKMVKIFRQVRRVLKNDGTLWLNLGDTYSNHKDCKSTKQTLSKNNAHVIKKGDSHSRNTKALKSVGLKNKDLVGIPWRVAFALQKDGWYLRQDIIWAKPNPMPESVTDRCTKSHEYIFLLSKSPKYYYDHEAIKEPLAESSKKRLAQDISNQKGSDRVPGKTNGRMKAVGHYKNLQENGQTNNSFHTKRLTQKDKIYNKRNKRDVWIVTTKPFKGAHFAVFPADLITPCIKAGSRKGDIVLDPFAGSGTTGMVAKKLDREFILIELNPKYKKIIEKRLKEEL